jgi:hypothetical protein
MKWVKLKIKKENEMNPLQADPYKIRINMLMVSKKIIKQKFSFYFLTIFLV